MLQDILLPTMRTLAEKAGAATSQETEALAGKMLSAGQAGKDAIGALAAAEPRVAAVQDELHAVFGHDFLKDGLPLTKRTNMAFMDFDPQAKPPAPAKSPDAEDLFPSVFSAINQSGADPARKEIMKKAARNFLGYQNPLTPLDRQVAELGDKVLLPFETVTKLGLSAVSQGSQILTGVVRTQYKDAFKNTIASFRDPDAQMFALESGAILSNIVRESTTNLFGKGNVPQQFLNLVGFTKTDMAARVFGAIQGAAHGEFQADALYKAFTRYQQTGVLSPQIAKIEQRLLSLGLDPRDIIAQGGRLTTDQKLLAANSVAFDVNFWGDSLSIPSFWRSPWGRVLTQFKSFAYQQARFVKNHVVQPWVKYGDYGPALRFATLIPIGGEAIADMKALLRNKQRTDKDAQRLLENISQAGGFGLVADAYLQASRGMSSMASFTLGPALTDILSATNAAAELTQGNAKPAAELGVRLAPGAIGAVAPAAAIPTALIGAGAPAVAETLFPSVVSNDRSRPGRERRETR